VRTTPTKRIRGPRTDLAPGISGWCHCQGSTQPDLSPSYVGQHCCQVQIPCTCRRGIPFPPLFQIPEYRSMYQRVLTPGLSRSVLPKQAPPFMTPSRLQCGITPASMLLTVQRSSVAVAKRDAAFDTNSLTRTSTKCGNRPGVFTSHNNVPEWFSVVLCSTITRAADWL